MELAAARQELEEIGVQEESLKAEENEFWRRYDALWLDLYVCRYNSCWYLYMHLFESKEERGRDAERSDGC